MKKVLLLLAATTTLFSCQTKEEKAQKLIDKHMFETLADYQSYEPIELKLDSAFHTAYIDEGVRSGISSIDSCFKVGLNNSRELRKAVDDMRLWVSSSTRTGRHLFEEADKKAKECARKSKEIHKALDDIEQSVKSKVKNIGNEYIGWKTVHKFRCKDEDGKSNLHNFLFVFDKDLTNIIYKEDIEDKINIRIQKDIKSYMEP